MSQLTDYSKKESWMILPENPASPELCADVFYVYPTGYFVAENGQPVCEITNATMRKRSSENTMNKGSALETVGNYYVPWYRQSCLEVLLSDDEETARPFVEKTIPDVFSAFIYYMEHYNNGRPYILLGHSQGSMIIRAMLATLFKAHPKYMENMVAAYIIGYSVTEDYLAKNPHLKFAQGADDTGVIISYNTEAPGITAPSAVLEPNSVVINPITWSRTDEYVPAAFNEGAHIVNRNPDGTLGEIIDRKGFASAKLNLERGVVECDSIPRESFPIVGAEDLFPQGIFHNGDLCLYYYDLRKNAKLRLEAWLEKNKRK